MRNPDRIPDFCNRLAEVWKEFPDWRFGQFIVNVFGDLGRDPFFIEDDKMIEIFEDYVNAWRTEDNAL